MLLIFSNVSWNAKKPVFTFRLVATHRGFQMHEQNLRNVFYVVPSQSIPCRSFLNVFLLLFCSSVCWVLFLFIIFYILPLQIHACARKLTYNFYTQIAHKIFIYSHVEGNAKPERHCHSRHHIMPYSRAEYINWSTLNILHVLYTKCARTLFEGSHNIYHTPFNKI